MEARKRKIRDRWIDIAYRGGTSLETLRRVRYGIVDDLRDDTKGAIEEGLYLPHGTVDRVLDGAGIDQFIDLPFPPRGQRPAVDDDIDPELRATWRRIRDRRGIAAADDWLRFTTGLRDGDTNSADAGGETTERGAS